MGGLRWRADGRGRAGSDARCVRLSALTLLLLLLLLLLRRRRRRLLRLPEGRQLQQLAFVTRSSGNLICMCEQFTSAWPSSCAGTQCTCGVHQALRATCCVAAEHVRYRIPSTVAQSRLGVATALRGGEPRRPAAAQSRRAWGGGTRTCLHGSSTATASTCAVNPCSRALHGTTYY